MTQQFWKWSERESCSVVSDSLPPHCLYSPRILQARILEWVAFPFSRGSRDRTQVSCVAGRFFTSWATREAQEYCMGRLSLLQGIFLTQELNRGLLNCRQILYQLSYQGSPYSWVYTQRTENYYSHKYLYDIVHSSSIQISQKVETNVHQQMKR